MQARDAAKVQTLTNSIVEHYGRTRIRGDGGTAGREDRMPSPANCAKAAEQLQWVIDKSGHEELAMPSRASASPACCSTTRSTTQALQALYFDAPAAYLPTVLDRRGDVLAAQNKTEEARAAYKDALAKADAQHPLRAHHSAQTRRPSRGRRVMRRAPANGRGAALACDRAPRVPRDRGCGGAGVDARHAAVLAGRPFGQQDSRAGSVHRVHTCSDTAGCLAR